MSGYAKNRTQKPVKKLLVEGSLGVTQLFYGFIFFLFGRGGEGGGSSE